VAAALQRPDLFAGAIGISGAYIFSEDRLVAGGGRFFSPDDSLEQGDRLARASCPILQFRLLHWRDDTITGFAQAERFAAMLNDRGCAAELVAFDIGGHIVAQTLTPQDRRREIEASNTALIPRER
jgi:predicted esterase